MLVQQRDPLVEVAAEFGLKRPRVLPREPGRVSPAPEGARLSRRRVGPPCLPRGYGPHAGRRSPPGEDGAPAPRDGTYGGRRGWRSQSSERRTGPARSGSYRGPHGQRGQDREQLAQYRGREIDTAGDGFLAAFEGPARAIRCAYAIIRAGNRLGLEIRAGLHTGECEIMGDKLSGIAVHTGARVAAIAAGGEVLVSGTVKDLVAGSGIRFEDRGVQSLRGIPGLPMRCGE
jgi:hypothetical protein